MNYPKTAQEAEAQGIAFFFTGKPCNKGHVDLRRWCRFTANGRSYLGSKCETCRKLNRSRHRSKDTASRLRNRINAVIRSRLKGSKHRCTTISQLLGCSVEEYMYYIERRWEAGMSWDNWGDWHIDHIRPCKIFDLGNQQQILQCFNYTNTRPVWATNNRNPGNLA
jgi:hypothetical protein